MASIYTRDRSPRYWAKFRGPMGNIRRMSTPFELNGDLSEAHALAWAMRMEELSAIYRESRNVDILEELVREGVEPLHALAAAIAGREVEKPLGLTLKDALHQHHAVQRLVRRKEAGDRHAASDLKRLHGSLELFAREMEGDSLSRLTLQNVVMFIERLRERGLAWDTRRHHLLALRRASAGAATTGRVDQLAGNRLDSRDDPLNEDSPAAEIYTTGQLRLLYTKTADNPPLQLAVGLMGFAGLRPSELIRLQAQDWDPAAKALRVGVRRRKNPSSRRDLPLPLTVARLLHRYTRKMKPDEHLLTVPHYPGRGIRKPTGRRALAETDLPKWWRKEMEALPAADKDKDEEELPLLPPKSLRKAWVSAAMWDLELPERLIDLYMGHKSPDLSPITTAHYLSRVTRRLREVADAFETLLVDD